MSDIRYLSVEGEEFEVVDADYEIEDGTTIIRLNYKKPLVDKPQYEVVALFEKSLWYPVITVKLHDVAQREAIRDAVELVLSKIYQEEEPKEYNDFYRAIDRARQEVSNG